MNICQGKNVYLIGIKGAGMAGLAQILKGLGYILTGSDIADTFFTDDILKRAGIPFRKGFDAKKIPKDIDWAVSSGAYINSSKLKIQNSKLQVKSQNFNENSEMKELERRRIPIMNYPEALAYFFNQCYGIAVTGTHGKSTTSAMIAHILTEAGKDPFALIGAELLNWHSNARVPKKLTTNNLRPTTFFVIEADEYREQFLHYKPQMIVITNIDYDHSDYFATQNEYKNAFEKFKKNLKPNGIIIESKKLHAILYTLQVPGKHNQENAAIAFRACKALGLKDGEIITSLQTYKGLRRRLETIGEYQGARIIDDYAHHPAEVSASLNALKEEYPNKRIIVLFHPHTYSRTKTFLKEFARSLILADEIYFLDVYASAREKGGDAGSDEIIEEIAKLGRKAQNLRTIENALNYMRKHLQKNGLLVTMGAGDVFRIAQQLANL